MDGRSPVIVLLIVMLSEATEPLLLVMGIHLACFFWFAMACHGELARTRPSATTFDGLLPRLAWAASSAACSPRWWRR